MMFILKQKTRGLIYCFALLSALVRAGLIGSDSSLSWEGKMLAKESPEGAATQAMAMLNMPSRDHV